VVLQPNAAGASCGLTLEYCAPAAPAAPPSLVVQLANPRLLLLARFAADALHGLDIIRAGLGSSGLPSGGSGGLDAPGGGEAACGAPGAGAGAGGAPPLQLLVHLTSAAVLLPLSSRCAAGAPRAPQGAARASRFGSKNNEQTEGAALVHAPPQCVPHAAARLSTSDPECICARQRSLTAGRGVLLLALRARKSDPMIAALCTGPARSKT